MKESKVYLNYSITDSDVDAIKSLGATAVICYDIRSNKKLPENTKVHFSEENRIQGTHEAYRYNRRVVDSLIHKKGRITISGTDVSPALYKLVYWTNYKIGAIKLTLKKEYPDCESHDKTSYFPDTYLKSLLKYFKLLVSNNRRSIKLPKKDIREIRQQYPIGILVNDLFELGQYKYIIEQLHPQEFALFHYGNIDFKNSGIKLEGVETVNLRDFQSMSRQKWINPFGLSGEELSVLNILSRDFLSISAEISGYRCIEAYGIRSLLMNEGENLPLRNLLKQVLGEKTTIYNTMNGMKSGEAQDSDITFDHWFVWSKAMGEWLSASTGLSRDIFIDAGHLAEDAIAHHSFANSIGIDLERLKDKKVITLFSVRGQRQEKKDAFNVLYERLKKDESCFLIIKPHPLEKPSDYFHDAHGNRNVIWVDEKLKNSKQAVYDLLSLSDLTIVFGSTVSIESKLFGVECLSVEYNDESLIIGLDDDKIKHITNREELERRLMNVSKKINNNTNTSTSKVSDKIRQVLKNNHHDLSKELYFKK